MYKQGTIASFLTESIENKCMFTTDEHFVDSEAMDSYNAGPGSKGFFIPAGNLLHGADTVVTAQEI